MKYFTRYSITKEQIDLLKRSLRVPATDKITDFDGNFVEHTKMEKRILVKKENELLDLIEEYLEPYADPWKLIQLQIERGEWVEYDFQKLPSKLKSYMYKMDSVFFERWYNERRFSVSVETYNEREKRLRRLYEDYDDEEFEKYVLLGHPFPTTDEIKARISSRRTYRVVNEIIKTNIDLFEHFITLTVADEVNKQRYEELNRNRNNGEYDLQFDYVDGTDFEEVKKKFSRCMDYLNRRLKKKGIPFEYIAVWEMQTNGKYHFHLLSTRIPREELYDVPEWLDYNYIEKKRNFGLGLKIWTYGKSDVQEIRSRAKLSTYVSKYIIKSFRNVQSDRYNEYLNKKKYFCTRGLKRPKVEYLDSHVVEKTLKELTTDNQPYIKQYVNPYNDSVITKYCYTNLQ